MLYDGWLLNPLCDLSVMTCDVSVWFVYLSCCGTLTYCQLCIGVGSKSCQALSFRRLISLQPRVGFQIFLLVPWDVKIVVNAHPVRKALFSVVAVRTFKRIQSRAFSMARV